MKNDKFSKFSLRSHLMNDMESQCLSFRYNMKGDSIGSLEVNKINVDGYAEHIMLEKWKNGDNKWYVGQVPIKPSGPFYIEFLIKSGWNRNSMFSIDDITVTKTDLCKSK